jgi:hypothetical protein
MLAFGKPQPWQKDCARKPRRRELCNRSFGNLQSSYLSNEEQIVKGIRRIKLFVFLRYHQHELLDEAFQQELAGLLQLVVSFPLRSELINQDLF